MTLIPRDGAPSESAPRETSVPVLGPSGFTSVAIRQWGPKHGPAVICLHGLTRNARDLDVLAAALAAAGHRVVAADMPGRGSSPWLADPKDYGYRLSRRGRGGDRAHRRLCRDGAISAPAEGLAEPRG
jgi:hypothetical protein